MCVLELEGVVEALRAELGPEGRACCLTLLEGRGWEPPLNAAEGWSEVEATRRAPCVRPGVCSASSPT